MSRRGSSLVEVLVALGILMGGLLVAYILLQNSFLGFKRLDRRQAAEAISLNIQDRYFHANHTELMKTFGGPTGSRTALETDPLVRENLPLPLKELKQLGFEMDAYAIGLDQGNGSSGLYFTTKVSWPVGSSRQCVTHSRVVASGLRPAELAAMGASLETPPATAPKPFKLLSLSVAGNVEAFGARAQAVESALAGKGRGAAIVFEGNQRVMDQMAAAGEVGRSGGREEGGQVGRSAGRQDGGAAGGQDGGAAGRQDGRGAGRQDGRGAGRQDGRSAGGQDGRTTGGQVGGSDTGGGWGGAGGGGGWGGDSGGGAGRGGPRGRRGPGFSDSASASDETTDWNEGESVATGREGAGYAGTLGGAGGTAPSGRGAAPRAARGEGASPNASASGAGAAEGLTPDPVDFLRAAAPQLSAEERLRLVPGSATTEEELARMWAPLEARKVPPGVYRYTTQAYLHVTATKVFRYEVLTLQAGDGGETYPLISRRELTGGQVTGAYMEGDAVVERKEVAVKAATPGVIALSERTAERTYVTRPVLLPDGSVAPFGREIAVSEGGGPPKDWNLGESRPVASEAFAAGTYQEKVATPRAGEAEIEEIAVNWASTRSRDAKRTVEPDAEGWKASDRYREAIEQINAGAPGRALEIVEELRRGQGTPPLELERLYASLLVQVDKMDAAAQVYGELSRRPEADASIHNNLAFIEIHRGNHGAALSAANAAIARDPAHLTAYVNAGIANEFLGKKEDAIAAYRAGLEKHPGAASLTEGLRRMGGL